MQEPKENTSESKPDLTDGATQHSTNSDSLDAILDLGVSTGFSVCNLGCANLGFQFYSSNVICGFLKACYVYHLQTNIDEALQEIVDHTKNEPAFDSLFKMFNIGNFFCLFC